jgi:hypothetical protein
MGMTTSDWIVLAVGIYAGITATATLLWSIFRERHNIDIRVRHAISVGLMENQEMLAIDVINNGRKPINIREFGFCLPNKVNLVNLKAQHNFGWLKDGDGTSYLVPKHDIEEMVKEAKKKGQRITAAYVRDSTSRYYKGKVSKRDKWFDQ